MFQRVIKINVKTSSSVPHIFFYVHNQTPVTKPLHWPYHHMKKGFSFLHCNHSKVLLSVGESYDITNGPCNLIAMVTNFVKCSHNLACTFYLHNPSNPTKPLHLTSPTCYIYWTSHRMMLSFFLLKFQINLIPCPVVVAELKGLEMELNYHDSY